MSLAGKVALVTGGGRGIGRGCALELASRGAHVVLNDRPGCSELETTAEAIRACGVDCHVIPADVFARAGCEQLLDDALAAAGQIDILVSNPAYSRRASFLEYPVDDFEKTLAGTLTSGFHMAQLVARHLVARGQGGKIVFISSVQAEMPNANCSPYGAAKAGLNHLMRSIAVELSTYRINVNAVEPGWIDTPGERLTFGDETITREAERLPWRRLGQPSDIGKAVAFLCSDDADYITGTVLPVDGLFRFKDCRAANQKPLQSAGPQ